MRSNGGMKRKQRSGRRRGYIGGSAGGGEASKIGGEGRQANQAAA